MHADRTNRVALILLGLLALLTGAAALTASAAGSAQPSPTVPVRQPRQQLHRRAWQLAMARRGGRLPAHRPGHAALDPGLLVSTDRAGEINVPGSEDHGTTILQAAALTGALTREIETYHGVDTASARVLGDAGDQELVITVTARQSADLKALHHRTKPRPSPTPGRQPANPPCPSSSISTSAAVPPSGWTASLGGRCLEGAEIWRGSLRSWLESWHWRR